MHVLAQLGDEGQSLGDQQVLSQWLEEIAFITNQLSYVLSYQDGFPYPEFTLFLSNVKYRLPIDFAVT